MPFRTFEIERKNILVFFRGIFRVLDCAVRASAKPLSMLFSVGMVHGALERNVNRDFESVTFGCGHEMPEIFQRSQLWMNRFVPPLFGPDGPWAADIIRLRGDRIVFPLPECVSDRMDWRKINH